MSRSEWILSALAVLMLIGITYGVVFLWWVRRYGGPRGLKREIRKRLSR